MFGPSTASVAPLQLSVDPLGFAIVAAVVFFVGAVVAPLVALSLRETRPPTADERAFLDRVGVDYRPERIHVIETAEGAVDVSIRGPPGRRFLLVTDGMLSDLDESTAEALIAAELARSRLFYIEYRAVAAAGIIGIATGMFGGLVTFSDGLFLLSVAALGLFWIGRRLQFAADSAAARQVGRERLAEAFEMAAAVGDTEPEAATWRTWFEIQPPLGQRIDRLRDRS